MVTLLWLLLVGVIALVVIVLATPVLVDLTVQTEPNKRLRLGIRCLGGWTPRIDLIDGTGAASPKPQPKPRHEPKSSRRRWAIGRQQMAAFADLLRGAISHIHLNRLAVDADIGLADPADTGQLYGMLTPLLYGACYPETVALSVRPDFAGARFSGRIDACIRVTPLALVPPALLFAWRALGPRS